jgi:hypothetical protein
MRAKGKRREQHANSSGNRNGTRFVASPDMGHRGEMFIAWRCFLTPKLRRAQSGSAPNFNLRVSSASSASLRLAYLQRYSPLRRRARGACAEKDGKLGHYPQSLLLASAKVLRPGFAPNWSEEFRETLMDYNHLAPLERKELQFKRWL